MPDTLRALVTTCRHVAGSDRQAAWRLVVLATLDAMRMPASVLLIKAFLDATAQGRTAELAVVGGAFAGVMFLGTLANVRAVDLRSRIQEKASLRFDSELVRLSGRLQTLDHHHDAAFADRMSVLRDRRESFGSAVDALLFALKLPLTLGVTVVLLVRLPWLLALLVAFALPSLATSVLAGRRRAQAGDRAARLRRQAGHLVELATGAAPAQEVRVYGLRDWLLERHAHISREIEVIAFRGEMQAALLQLAGWSCFVAAYGAGMALVLAAAGRGQLTVGEVALAGYLGVQVGTQVAQVTAVVSGLSRALGITNHYLWLQRYVDAAEQAQPTSDVPARLRSGLCAENLGFTYPGAVSAALREVSFSAPAGTLVALVGENGAGKTTLVKLLCGLHRPSHGRITVDGVDVSSLDVDAWRRRVTAGFQDFAMFELPARESVGVGELAVMDDRGHVHRAVQRAGAEPVVEALPQGIDTQLGAAWPDGADLSHGMWQKLAVARAFMREAPLLCILDEPASALDPESEDRLVQRYIRGARALGEACGAVSVVVSHRLSTVRAADLVVVLHEGTSVETGTHDELLRHGGRYAELYALHAAAYAPADPLPR